MRRELDARDAVTCTAFHKLISQALDFPDYYGRNLDALHDCLTDLPAGTELVIRHAAALREHLGAVYTDRLRRVLDDASRHGRFTCLWEEET